MFDVPGIQFYWPGTPIQPGEAVAIVIRHFGSWSLNCCKIVYVIDEEGPVRRFGFAYGTLPEHASKERSALRLNGIARRMWFLTTSYLSLDRSALPQESRLR